MHVKEGCLACKAERGRAYNVNNAEHVARVNAIYNAHKRDREKKRERDREYYHRDHAKSQAKNATWRAANKEWHKDWRARNAAAIQVWRDANREKTRALANRWRAENPSATRIHKQNRRARLTGDRLSPGIVQKLYRLQRGKCACCGRPLASAYHIDHIVPLALGGRNVDTNVQLLRKVCNLQKSAKDPIRFMQQRGFLL